MPDVVVFPRCGRDIGVVLAQQYFGIILAVGTRQVGDEDL